MNPFRRPAFVLALTLCACRPGGKPVCFEAKTRAAQPGACEARAHAHASAPARAGLAPLRVAVTLDDLPGGYDAQPGYPKSRQVAELVHTLKARGIPAVGFVNGIYAEGDADARAGLETWIAAGFELGNHSYSHRSARAQSAPEFLGDISRNRIFLRELAPERPARFFRFPYLERGNSPDERIAITQALAREGYRIADVSIDFADWTFAGAYARCMARGDGDALRALAQSYLERARAGLYWSAEGAERVFGRAVPHVLLLHVQLATVLNLDALVSAYEEAGVRWITLDEALADPVYQEDPGRDHGDNSLIKEAAYSAGRPLQSFVPRALPLLDLTCR